MNPPTRHGAIVIGAGQSGPFLAARLAGAGIDTVLVEKRWLGGTCVNDGCMPTKTLVACARAAWVARNAARWGVLIQGEVGVDMKVVKARKDAVVHGSRASLDGWLRNLPHLEVIEGSARFVDAHRVAITAPGGGERLVEGERIFINVGARPVVPALPGIDAVPFFTSESIMDVDFVPPHLVILGGSYIGLEFAQMYRRFGSAVTVVERGDRLLPREDVEVSRVLGEMLAGEGVEVLLGATASALSPSSAGGFALHVGLPSGPRVIEGSHLLLAIGRAPATAGLGLPAAGVAVDGRGYITTDDQLRTSAPHIYALGDVNGRGAFTHTSYDDFQIVSQNLLDGASRRVSERIPIYGLYTDPPLGRCGMTLAEARATSRPLLVGTRQMKNVGRAKERGETTGFMQIVVDAETRRILGAAILGIEGDEAIHSIVDTMYAGAPFDVLMRAVHAHPTVSELIPTVLESLRPDDASARGLTSTAASS